MNLNLRSLRLHNPAAHSKNIRTSPAEVFPSAHSSMRGDQFLSMFILLAKRYFVLPPVTDPVHKPKKMSVDANILALASVKECGERLIYGTADRRTKTGNLQNLRMLNLEK